MTLRLEPIIPKQRHLKDKKIGAKLLKKLLTNAYLSKEDDHDPTARHRSPTKILAVILLASYHPPPKQKSTHTHTHIKGPRSIRKNHPSKKKSASRGPCSEHHCGPLETRAGRPPSSVKPASRSVFPSPY